MKTPSIIWQTWKTKDRSKLPPKFLKYTNEWKSLHPDFHCVLLDDDDLRDIVAKTVPHHLDAYDNFTQNIERVDFARYALLYRYGGVYADMDTYPLKHIGVWADTDKIVLGCEPSEHATKIYGRDKVLCNALMISPPSQMYWKKLMDYIIDNYEHNYNPVDTTGPMAMTKLYEESIKNKDSLHADIIITDPCVFYPMTGDGVMSKHCSHGDPYVVHVWENTWTPDTWYSGPLIYNKRYWFYGIIILIIILMIACIYRK